MGAKERSRSDEASLGGDLLWPARGNRTVGIHYLRFLAACHEAFLDANASLPAELSAAHRQTGALVRELIGTSQRATLACYASSAVSTPLMCLPLKSALPDFAERIDAAIAAVVPHLLLELAVRGLLPDGFSSEVPWRGGRLASPSLGMQVSAPSDATALRFDRAGITALQGLRACAHLALASPETAQGFRVKQAYVRLGDITRLALVDHNPVATFEVHPDKSGNGLDLGGHSVSEWTAALSAALRVIDQYCPEISAEMRPLLHEIVPVGFDAERHLSASYREAIGTVYLTLHPHTMTLAEAVIHEFQHNKLNLFSYRAALLQNAFEPRYPSPVRPDPRPLWGILLAVHAFLPVAVLYRRMQAAKDPMSLVPGFARRLSDIDLKNHEAFTMLERHAEWTPPGEVLFRDIAKLDTEHTAERAAQGLTSEPDSVHPE